jgi:hypothetical protein
VTSNTSPQTACGAGATSIIYPAGRVIACIGRIVDLETDHPPILGNPRPNYLTEILDRAECNPVIYARTSLDGDANRRYP